MERYEQQSIALGSKGCRQPPLVAHVIFRLAVGGLENGLVNLINWMPEDRYRHAIICLTESTDFEQRITRRGVPIIELHKRPGHDLGVYRRMWTTLRDLSPDLVHTRNLPALEFLVLAALVSRAGRIHGEHGRDVYDIDGANRKYNILRRVVKRFVHRYTAVSADLAQWLVGTVGVPPSRVHQIYNGVDIKRFCPRQAARQSIGPEGFMKPDSVVIGTVGRMQAVKDQLTLVRAFIHLLQIDPTARESVRLVLIGDGPLRHQAQCLLQQASADVLSWMPGERSDIPLLMQSLDIFVLPSLGEGISNTILEAMACGLPVVATRVGGSPELVEEGKTGLLVPPSSPVEMAQALRSYVTERRLMLRHGQAGRRKVLAQFSPQNMVGGYLATYDAVLHRSSAHARVLAETA